MFAHVQINPSVDDWEAKGRFPAHEVFKKLGSAGFLGLCKPVLVCWAGSNFSLYHTRMSRGFSFLSSLWDGGV